MVTISHNRKSRIVDLL